jgi:hypothetical protein
VGGEGEAVAAVQQRLRPAGELAEVPERGRIAHERPLLLALLREEGVDARARAVVDGAQQRTLRAVETVALVRELLEVAADGIAQRGQRRHRAGQLVQGRRIRLPQRRPQRSAGPGERRADRHAPAAAVAAVVDCAQLIGGELGDADERVLADDDQRGEAGRQPVENLRELQHVVQVALEPQEDVLPRVDRPSQPGVPLGHVRAHGRLVDVVARGEEAGASGAQLGVGQAGGHRALVQDVAPRQDGPRQTGGPEHGHRAVAVGDVQHGQECRNSATARNPLVRMSSATSFRAPTGG